MPSENVLVGFLIRGGIVPAVQFEIRGEGGANCSGVLEAEKHVRPDGGRQPVFPANRAYFRQMSEVNLFLRFISVNVQKSAAPQSVSLVHSDMNLP